MTTHETVRFTGARVNGDTASKSAVALLRRQPDRGRSAVLAPQHEAGFAAARLVRVRHHAGGGHEPDLLAREVSVRLLHNRPRLPPPRAACRVLYQGVNERHISKLKGEKMLHRVGVGRLHDQPRLPPPRATCRLQRETLQNGKHDLAIFSASCSFTTGRALRPRLQGIRRLVKYQHQY